MPDSPASIKFKLDQFEGPLDLLLHLIRINEVDIFDIPIIRITEQYQRYLDMMKEVDIDLGSEFMLMAATLIHIKTKMLLPQKEGEEDPRAELVERLLEHQQYKAAAEVLEQKEERENKVWYSTKKRMKPFMEVEDDLVEIDIFQLIAAFQKAMKSIGRIDDLEILHQQYSIDEKIQKIESEIRIKPKILFSDLMRNCRNKRELVATFLAILELIRRRIMLAAQTRTFGEIVLVATDTSQSVISIDK